MSSQPSHFLVIGAGAAGLIAARDLAAAGKRVTVLEARDRCGGRIDPLPVEEFGYSAEGGAEFVHGAAPVTRALLAEAGLALQRRTGTRWSLRSGQWSRSEEWMPHADKFYRALRDVKLDLPVAAFLERHFGDAKYAELRRSVTRTVEGYDAADPHRFSTLALRDEWLARDDGEHGRVEKGYGALIDWLAGECRRCGAAIHLGAAITAIENTGHGVTARCGDGTAIEADAVILTVPLPILSEIALPASARTQADAAADIGYGNVVKLLLRFTSPWWVETAGRDLSDLSFLLSNAPVPTWWTQFPDPHPVLTGWYAGPKADRVAGMSEAELIEMGLSSLAEIFAVAPDRLRRGLVAARAINWGNDPLAGGAYSYATPKSRDALAVLKQASDAIFFSGEALYAGVDMGTVEAALASGQETARTLLTGSAL